MRGVVCLARCGGCAGNGAAVSVCTTANRAAAKQNGTTRVVRSVGYGALFTVRRANQQVSGSFSAKVCVFRKRRAAKALCTTSCTVSGVTDAAPLSRSSDGSTKRRRGCVLRGCGGAAQGSCGGGRVSSPIPSGTGFCGEGERGRRGTTGTEGRCAVAICPRAQGGCGTAERVGYGGVVSRVGLCCVERCGIRCMSNRARSQFV